MDNLSSEIITAGKNIILPILVRLFNYILLNGKYPKDWAEGMVTPLYKKGLPLMTDNYRGITITSCLGKVFGIAMNVLRTSALNTYLLMTDNLVIRKGHEQPTIFLSYGLCLKSIVSRKIRICI